MGSGIKKSDVYSYRRAGVAAQSYEFQMDPLPHPHQRYTKTAFDTGLLSCGGGMLDLKE